MNVYTIHVKQEVRLPEILVIREGFCWPAFVFGPLWALRHRLWAAFATLCALIAALLTADWLLRPNGLVVAAAAAAVVLFAGFAGNDWRRAAAELRGWRMAGLAAAPDRDSALRRYFDLNPAADR